MFAHKSHLTHADAALAAQGLGRAHHRVLYIVSRYPGGKVGQILSFLGITKQSLGRIMKDLIEKGMVELRHGEPDRRTRLVFLTSKGRELEKALFNELHENMARAYDAAGKTAVEGYWTLMQHLMSPSAHENFTAFNQQPLKAEAA